MLALSASKWDVTSYILDPVRSCPAADVCTHLVLGDYTNYETVVEFGKQVDMITLEIENVNVDALHTLKEMVKTVHPDPDVIQVLQDKGLQKLFYEQHNLPTAPFSFFKDKTEILNALETSEWRFPFVQKSRKAGYDGKGVNLINSSEDIPLLFDVPSILEEQVKVAKELSVIVARNQKGETKCFEVVEMEFNAEANLVERLICPSSIDENIALQAKQLAIQIIESFQMCGILAVEFFLTQNGKLLVNEAAPRPHNSGHHTIESTITSQYEQQLRAIFNFPLGSTKIKLPAVMINLLGEAEHSGKVKYEGLTESMEIEGVQVHIYGKKETKPFRKMGHATVMSSTIEEAKDKANQVKQLLKVKSWKTQE